MCRSIINIQRLNFHLDDPSDNDAKNFTDLLETFGLSQHVTAPTHLSGHTLDLLISRSSNDINVSGIEFHRIRPNSAPPFERWCWVKSAAKNLLLSDGGSKKNFPKSKMAPLKKFSLKFFKLASFKKISLKIFF